MDFDIIDSPLGNITVIADGKNVVGVHIHNDRYFSHPDPTWIKNPTNPVLSQAKKELDEYFTGSRKVFSLPIASRGTEFQNKVWAALRSIEPGGTSTYQKIAEKIGRPNAVRAVGSAIGRNPLCIIVPCHRVLSSNGTLGGYVAGLAIKTKLLELEQASLS